MNYEIRLLKTLTDELGLDVRRSRRNPARFVVGDGECLVYTGTFNDTHNYLLRARQEMRDNLRKQGEI